MEGDGGVLFRKIRLWLCVGLVLGWMTFAQACGCGEEGGRDNPTEISFIEPRGTLITEGRVVFKVKDFDGLATVKFSIDDKVIKTFDLEGEKAEKKLTVTFDLDAQPSEFSVKVETEDTLELTDEERRTFRKESGPPLIKIVAPEKIDPQHNSIYVGKNFKVAAEGRDDTDGVGSVEISLRLQSGNIRKLRTCSGSKVPGKSDRCESEVDASDDKEFPEGPLVVLAKGTDSKGNESPPVQKQILLDKSGPQIRILDPKNGQQLSGVQQFRALVADQAGVAKVAFYLGGKELQNVQEDANKPGQYVTAGSVAGFGSGSQEFKVTAVDKLGNTSEEKNSVRLGCQTDADCAHKPGTRCCLSKSATNSDGTKTGTCFPTQAKAGDLCDPCTQPCGNGPDGKLMGCLPQPCTDKPPYRCRPACNLGNPNRRPDKCAAANPALGLPAEYCARSDITKINPILGACAIGHLCDPLNQQVCPQGMKPPYKNCCPSGMSCFPADDDANFCVPEGNKQIGETGCNNNICTGVGTCARGSVCVTRVGPDGRPVGQPRCEQMCKCDSFCKRGLPLSSGGCKGGSLCSPLILTNGRVPLPVGACTSP